MAYFLTIKMPPNEGRRRIIMSKIFSLDAEVDGLYGPSFAIAATVRENGAEIAKFEGRVPDSVVTDGWVKENVLPALGDMEVTHQSSKELEEAFWAFWKEHKDGSIVIAHCGSPVESGLFRRCVERDLESRQWDGPFPAIHDVATLLLALGEKPDSVDSYNESHGIVVPFNGVSHHPMYDSVAAAVAWEHAFARLQDLKGGENMFITIPGSGGEKINTSQILSIKEERISASSHRDGGSREASTSTIVTLVGGKRVSMGSLSVDEVLDQIHKK